MVIRHLRSACLLLAALGSAFAQTPAAFEIADVHVAPKTANIYLRISAPHGGRYELHNATIVDLIRLGYGIDADKVLGGPSWLEMNRYDVIAKVPADATLETAASMLQPLLAERFHLKFHNETKQLPSYVLVAGKKPTLKEPDDSGDTGCRPQESNAGPGNGGGMLMMSGPDGKVTQIALGPNSLIAYRCRNVTMESFAAALRTMVGAAVGTNPVRDETGLKGTWNFELKYSLGFSGMAGNTDRISIQEAVEKQLGLKLEERPVPVPVLIVDSVDEKPGANPPGLAQALPPIAVPKEFDVANIKQTSPDYRGISGFRTLPGGRFTVTSMPASLLVQRAFPSLSNDQIIGLPPGGDGARFDITATTGANLGTNPDPETLAPLLLSLLKERFGFRYHSEERPLPAYNLVAVKPKMKQADPASRTHCPRANGPAGAPPGTTVMTCQNITMAQFTEQLRGMVQGLQMQPLDTTGLEGGWDFVLTWNQRAGMNMGPVAPRAPDGGGAGDMAAAADPSGGYTLFEALTKQLGLKLESEKRPLPVIVVDHLDAKPTEN